jgi:hypothetical protein
MRYVLNPNLYHIIKDGQLLVTLSDPNRDEIYSFEGPAIQILSELFSSKEISIANMEKLAASYGAPREDIESLWNFCLTEEFILSA